MSGAMRLRGVLVAALRGDDALMALVNSVEDAGAPKQSAPALVIGALATTDWGARGVHGLAVRVPLSIVDRADRPERTALAAERVDAVMRALPPDAGGGWRIGAVRGDRSRSVRSGDGRWSMQVDYLVRMSRLD